MTTSANQPSETITADLSGARITPTAPKPATPATKAHQDAVRASLDFTDRQQFDDAQRGFIATIDQMTIVNDSGRPVWNLEPYGFLADDAPDTVNPSLWRMSQLNNRHGLFEVCEGIYQVRGFDISNMSVIVGKTGYILIDPMTSVECAAAGLALVRRELGDRPVSAVIYTHSHADHFGGVRGVIADGEQVDVIAPAGFLEHAVSENVDAGEAMLRRSGYMFGALLEPSPTGLVSAGLGMTTPSGGLSLIAPTTLITHTGEEREIDGVRFVFQMAPHSEAPAEMHFHLPDHRALCLAENVTQHMHNVLTPRGAQIRDTAAWSDYIHEALQQYCDDTDVLFISHHWPVWGSDNIKHFLTVQRDMYRFIHDETLRHMANGLTPLEIAEVVELPPALAREWSCRGYYGSLVHNVKAVYQRYLGFFDGNPANLHPLPPSEAGRRYVEFMGGADRLLEQAQASYDKGDYRWVAEVVNHLVFADPDNVAARHLQADTLEQLGYQAEAGPWRNFYLSGAAELRHGVQQRSKGAGGRRNDLQLALTTSMLLAKAAIKLNGPRAANERLEFALHISDTDENWRVELSNGVLIRTQLAAPSDNGISVPRLMLAAVLFGRMTIDEAITTGKISGGDQLDALGRLVGLLDAPEAGFNIVTP